MSGDAERLTENFALELFNWHLANNPKIHDLCLHAQEMVIALVATVKASLTVDHPAQDLGMVVPDGWQLAPIEPTEEMLNAAMAGTVSNQSATDEILLYGMLFSLYKKMMAAKPTAPVQSHIPDAGKMVEKIRAILVDPMLPYVTRVEVIEHIIKIVEGEV